jgi:hypothetical protein
MTKSINQTIVGLQSFSCRKELRSMLEGHTLSVKSILIREKIDSLDEEIEMDIKDNHIELATFKLSQSVILEEELNLVERLIIKSAVRNL